MRVLLLHGIGGGAAIWHGSVAALRAAGHDAVAIDFPGYGGAPGAPTMDAMVAAAAAQADADSVLVGHSMGGMVVQELLARDAAPLRAAVLACTSASFGSADGAWQAAFVAERLQPLDDGLGMAGLAAQLVPGMVSPAASGAARDAASAVMARVPEASYRVALRAIAAFDRRDALGRITIPVLCLAGEHDRTAPPATVRRMADRIPHARFETLAAAGHIANVEQPAAFDAALLAFLETL